MVCEYTANDFAYVFKSRIVEGLVKRAGKTFGILENNDSVATTVMVNDKEVNVRTITVEDRTGKVKVSLWRNIAAEPVVLGDVVAITNIVVNSKRYNNEESLSSTQFTKIETYEIDTS
ncbi:hypothetical protein MAR_013949 [Mya arenaria]|uniref:Shieldin complex subunit 2 first OB fold domain-containing protein n=1 Tax=Mya arenaria TaxID=6604 RepID=A0ABY7G1Z0_MYAAR|nr:hypothetical protein MAR_013949 [Mya arenaria]